MDTWCRRSSVSIQSLKANKSKRTPKKKQKTGQLCSPCVGERKEEKVDLVGAAPRGQARRRDPTRWRPAAAPTRKQRHRHRVLAPVPVLLRAVRHACTAAPPRPRRAGAPVCHCRWWSACDAFFPFASAPFSLPSPLVSMLVTIGFLGLNRTRGWFRFRSRACGSNPRLLY